MLRNEIKKAIKEVTDKTAKVEHPLEAVFGDYSTNVAMKEQLNPIDVAEKLKSNPLFEKVEVKSGFINFFISKDYLKKQVKDILEQKDKYGQPASALMELRSGKKVQVEFISANPTGPLTLGNGRGGFCGDVLVNVLKKVGYKVEREYYINDRGNQINKLGHSVIGDDEAVYKGEYIAELREKIKGDDAEKVGEKAAKHILDKMIKPTIKKMGIKYDVWFSEKSLYKKKQVEKTLNELKKQKLAYTADDALWFRSTEFGDDKDRVLVKSTGEETYLASDVAYLKNKKDRGFDKIVYYWGADHHGYVGRLKAGSQALGFSKDDFEIILMQLVKLFQDGKEVKMSKRAGTYVTLDELFEEVGVDVARYFFLSRANNTHLNFDLNLAKEQSQKNPVYYVQYAHARISGILKKSKKQTTSFRCDRNHLNHPSELKLIKQLIRFPEIIEDTAKDYQLQRLPHYATELATYFHKFYTECRVIDEENKDLTQARLALVEATRIVLKNTLNLMGIQAPDKM